MKRLWEIYNFNYMKKKIWFRAKTYGWGWTPSSWEGWLAIVLYIGAAFLYIRGVVDTALDGSGSGTPFYYHLLMALATLGLILLGYRKGEKPGWRWGRGAESDEDVRN